MGTIVTHMWMKESRMRRGKTHPERHTKETSGSGALVA
jgi:hypothetical protein|tara:strand:- start:307 stop:420 length:114 start_codon:yes stop_codon:yes gene_type:complete